MDISSKSLIFSFSFSLFLFTILLRLTFLIIILHTVKCTGLKCIIWWVLANAQSPLPYQYIEESLSLHCQRQPLLWFLPHRLASSLLELLGSTIIEHMLFCVAFALTTGFLRFILVAACIHSFLFLSHIPWYEYTSFVYPFSCWHLSDLAIMNHAAVIILEQVFVWVYIVTVSQGGQMKCHRLGGLNDRNFFSHSYGS